MTERPRSTASIGGHPMLVPFPIVFLVSTFLCDLVFWQTQGEIWTVAAMWLLGAGLVSAAMAAVVGLIDFSGDARIRSLSDAWLHMIGNVIAVVLSLVSFYMRWRYGAAAAVMPWGFLISTIVFGLLLFNGWKGGELVFRHHVGMVDGTERRAAAGGVGSERLPEGPRRASPAE